ncbi:MAG: hypothetical protein D6785_02470 [Planctomycetota bacterium]|nr:MAG: hypothetical protein D6785_02470 [Planctomycetota bacterium]
MKFRKTGKEILDCIQRYVEVKKDQLKRENEIFEREKEKRALQAIHELQIDIRRLENLLPHIESDLEYWLTEDDLQDFGFFYQASESQN